MNREATSDKINAMTKKILCLMLLAFEAILKPLNKSITNQISISIDAKAKIIIYVKSKWAVAAIVMRFIFSVSLKSI